MLVGTSVLVSVGEAAIGVLVRVAVLVAVAVRVTVLVGLGIGGTCVTPSYRANPKCAPLALSADPAATILPSDCIATAYAASELPAKSVVTLPSPLKLVSRLPSGLYRASAKSFGADSE